MNGTLKEAEASTSALSSRLGLKEGREKEANEDDRVGGALKDIKTKRVRRTYGMAF